MTEIPVACLSLSCQAPPFEASATVNQMQIVLRFVSPSKMAGLQMSTHSHTVFVLSTTGNLQYVSADQDDT